MRRVDLGLAGTFLPVFLLRGGWFAVTVAGRAVVGAPLLAASSSDSRRITYSHGIEYH